MIDASSVVLLSGIQFSSRPALTCSFCGMYLYPEYVGLFKSTDGDERMTYMISHPYPSDERLEMDLEFPFCPNNARIFRISLRGESTWGEDVTGTV